MEAYPHFILNDPRPLVSALMVLLNWLNVSFPLVMGTDYVTLCQAPRYLSCRFLTTYSMLSCTGVLDRYSR